MQTEEDATNNVKICFGVHITARRRTMTEEDLEKMK